jgi:class 3 adenylate cyclase
MKDNNPKKEEKKDTLNASVSSAPVLKTVYAVPDQLIDTNAILYPNSNAYARIPGSVSLLNEIIHGTKLPFVSTSFSNQIDLQDEINSLKRKMADLVRSSEVDKADKKKIAEDFKELQRELQVKEKINHIVPRICDEARKLLFESDDFKALFADARACNAVVLSIDIRRSTELMLKARKPELFAKFITELTQKLSAKIIDNYGIFDKFTGDGILAFFPDFYSGKDAMFYALKAAQECHEVFNKHYYSSRDCFNVFIKSAGLGIGVDYGQVTLVNTNNELTVVGIPVVYSCRMSGADAGTTILNQPAMEFADQTYKNHTTITETEINLKNEGVALAYRVDINAKAVAAEKPNWSLLIEKYLSEPKTKKSEKKAKR